TDGAYDTKQCRQVIADRQAHAVITPRKNAKPWKDKKMGSLERNELLRTVKRLEELFGRNGQAIIGEVWLKPRCIASNY
ncbi:putative iSSpo9, transposase, partial [Acinetobacter baumannii 42057_2]